MIFTQNCPPQLSPHVLLLYLCQGLGCVTFIWSDSSALSSKNIWKKEQKKKIKQPWPEKWEYNLREGIFLGIDMVDCDLVWGDFPRIQKKKEFSGGKTQM